MDVQLPAEVKALKEKADKLQAAVLFQGGRLNKSIQGLQSAKLNQGPRKQIAEDALTAFSVALRIDLEALALIPFALANIVRSIYDAPGSLLTSIQRKKSFKSLKQISDLPNFAERIASGLKRQLLLTEPMAEALSELTARELDDTAGFALQESVVDQIVGIGLDSFKASLKIDGEMFFFNQLGGDDTRVETKDSDGNTTGVKDFTGRTRRLTYDVDPIYMLGIRFNAGFDWIKLPDAAGIKFGFATDRVFSSGGSIETSTLGEQLGLEGFASDIFDIGLGVLGVRSNVKIATFNFGEVRGIEIDPVTGDDLGTAREPDGNKVEAPMTVKYTQIDVGYDIGFLVYDWRRKWFIEEIWLGYRFFDYRLPRILYELEGESDDLSFVRQSPAQTLDSTYHMGGFRFRFGPGGAPRIHPYLDLSFFVGGGPTSYYFCSNNDECVVEPRRDANKEFFFGSQFAINGGGNGGLKVRLTPKLWPVRAHAGLQYTFEVISASISQAQAGGGDNRSVDLGSSEIFHGPQFLLHGEL